MNDMALRAAGGGGGGDLRGLALCAGVGGLELGLDLGGGVGD